MTSLEFLHERRYGGDDEIDVVLRIFVGDLPVSVNAILDTGAMNSIFAIWWAPHLGVTDVKSGRPFPVKTADNRESTAYLHDLDVEFFGQRMTVPVGFVPDWTDATDNLLGMNGFFDQLLFGLDHQHRRFYFTVATI